MERKGSVAGVVVVGEERGICWNTNKVLCSAPFERVLGGARFPRQIPAGAWPSTPAVVLPSHTGGGVTLPFRNDNINNYTGSNVLLY